jgi:hypothetical protein
MTVESGLAVRRVLTLGSRHRCGADHRRHAPAGCPVQYWGATPRTVDLDGDRPVGVRRWRRRCSGAAPASHAGIASGVNNGVARAASLLAIAALPVIVGLKGDAYQGAGQFLGPFRDAMWICCGMFLVGAVGLDGHPRPGRRPGRVRVRGQSPCVATGPGGGSRRSRVGSGALRFVGQLTDLASTRRRRPGRRAAVGTCQHKMKLCP